MMTDQDYEVWLNDPSAIRVVLFEANVNSGGVEITRYLATGAYVTGAADTPPNTAYLPVATGGLQLSETISLTAEASMSAGDVEIYNYAGERDSWLDDIWTNRSFKAWIGDPRWVRADFRLIFNGVAADINSKDRNTLNIQLRDKLQQLNTPVSEHKLGGTTPNADNIIPLVFGEVHNITPLLTNPATLEYQCHDGAVEDIFEVRDNGKPVAVTKHNDTGKFELLASPAGAITVSIQGDKPAGVYYNTISKLIQRIVTQYGKESDRFTIADLDTDNLDFFDVGHQQPVGMYLGERVNVLNACQQLASSIGAQMIMSRTGLLRLIQINLPPYGTPLEIYATQQVNRSIQIVGRTEVAAAVKIGYCKNWTVQAGLQTSIPAEHKDLFAQEWLTKTSTDVPTQTQYRLNTEPVEQDTMLLTLADASVEADRRLTIFKQTRTTYRFEGTPSLLLLELGQTVKLFSSRFGLQDGKIGVVTSLTPNWLNGHIMVEVLI